jgi:ABC-2 type transport system permease protein
MRIQESFRNIDAICRRELAGYFGSPVAYVFIVIFLILVGFFTFNVSNFSRLAKPI